MKGTIASMTDSGLATWSSNFAAQLAIIGLAIHVSPAVIAAVQQATTDFGNALAASTDESTRTKVTILTKQQMRTALLALISQTISLVNGLPDVTDQQKITLGMSIRKKPTPSPVASTPPVGECVGVSGRNVQFRVHAQGGTKRSKPPGQQGVMAYIFIGDAAPTSVEGWRSLGLVTRSTFEVPTGAPDTACTVWLTFQWVNTKGETGPAGPGVPVCLPALSPVPQAGEKMRLAA